MYSFEALITYGIIGSISASFIWAGAVIVARLADRDEQ